jgi:hypothetical protein
LAFWGKTDIVEFLLIKIRNYWLKNLDPKVLFHFLKNNSGLIIVN